MGAVDGAGLPEPELVGVAAGAEVARPVGRVRLTGQGLTAPAVRGESDHVFHRVNLDGIHVAPFATGRAYIGPRVVAKNYAKGDRRDR